ncbi:DNA mismatch repair endonuclease MutL [Alteromonas sp. ASW11-36]|uniref:DNA mismatch repair protein MutL n=1 Tax=Alteromonas arenosi TaxID=3055817 RepID=A0ABT7SS91_9ALTE|nr:DNA mismatch repair endonuclease MutL [Alteromonas sp. ASW11-36]MDM7859060.1 DNA mismatch repair endonuclease MutL [Alteromonas sp. ASW11-36]
MSIQRLPAELANQIAAGEVVERPASVVKELVENSIDAGATMIEVEIYQGGHKQILIRDNGKGIPRDELELALSRHATSKIKSLDDLEAIASMGFRGEALASISSVSRLTLTSKTAVQNEAWQAQAQGRDMEVEILPAAHPVGTSVRVDDLFFNTPARRRFLRTEKTEFSHIETVFRRIALGHQNIGFTLKHNGKRVKQVKATESLYKRVSDLLGKTDERQLLALEAQCEEATLQGFIVNPSAPQTGQDWQYSFVNHRPMRDKLINHAIRQAFELLGLTDVEAQYVLFVEVEPSDVDVNVHPAKHEVRFHHARTVHDFIVSQVKQTLSTAAAAGKIEESLAPLEPLKSHQYSPPQQLTPQSRSASSSSHQHARTQSTSDIARAGQSYTQLMSVTEASQRISGFASMRLANQLAFAKRDDNGLWVVSNSVFLHLYLQQSLAQCSTSQPLLMPVAIPSTESWSESLRQALAELNIHVDKVASKLILKQVPAGWRGMPWSMVLAPLLSTCLSNIAEQLCQLCAAQLVERESLIEEALQWWASMAVEHQHTLLANHGVWIDLGQSSVARGQVS